MAWYPSSRDPVAFIWLHQAAWQDRKNKEEQRQETVFQTQQGPILSKTKSDITREATEKWAQLTRAEQEQIQGLIMVHEWNRHHLDTVMIRSQVHFDLEDPDGVRASIRRRNELMNAKLAVGQSLYAIIAHFKEGKNIHLPDSITREYLHGLHNTLIKELQSERKKIDNLKLLNEDFRLAQSLGEGWVGPWVLGRGAYGVASVFVKQNSQGLIIDRVVVKHTENDIQETVIWDAWTGEPNEARAMADLNFLDDSEPIVILRNWRLGVMSGRPIHNNTYRRPYRLYMEYCPYGDLYAILRYYSSGFTQVQTEFVPEPFVWHIFECLLIAGRLMEQGNMDPDGDPDWDLIVHRDIKAANVFLGDNETQRFPGYPMPKLGDFGKAVYIPPFDIRRPDTFGVSGTLYNTAPEHWWESGQNGYVGMHRFPGEQGPRSLTSAANIWAIGNVIWSLLMSSHGDPGLNFANPATREPREFDPVIKAQYSQVLQDLIRACINYLPEQRPSFDQAWAVLRKALDDDPHGLHAGGLRDMPADRPIWRQYAVPLGHDRWPIHLLLANAPPLDHNRRPPSPPSSVDTEGNNGAKDDFGGNPGLEVFMSDQTIDLQKTP